MSAKSAPRMWGSALRSIFLALLTTAVLAIGTSVLFFGVPPEIAALFSSQSQAGAVAAAIQSPFIYEFKVRSVLEESDSPDESSSPYWWLESGARMMIEDGVGKTVQGSLPLLDRSRIRYSFSNRTDTENGHAPQNLFRLLSRSSWENVRAESSFRIVRDNFTESPNRNELNGLLLMSRYQDKDNLYAAGIRVDGQAVITKKFKGTYYLMAEEPIFEGEYGRDKDVNLLPHDEWIAIRTETKTDLSGAVTIKVFMKRKDETSWTQILTAIDDGKKYENTPTIIGSHPIGIRTDFMDVEFDNFKAEKI